MAKVFTLLSLFVTVSVGNACTTLIAGKLATLDGSVMASQSDDAGANPDARLIRVPAQDHAAGSMRPIFYDTHGFPRYVGTERGDIPQYAPGANPGFNQSTRIGQIPQVPHTYAYYEGVGPFSLPA
jgi:dipeptidase